MMSRIPELKTGLSRSVQKKITIQDTALNFGSGALKNLLATPTLAALMIEAAVATVDPLLPDRYITVGKTSNLIHQEPTVAGMMVTVTAKLTEIDRNRLIFEISAYDELGPIGTGIHERFIVNYDAFIDRAAARCKSIENKVN